jgi:L-lysine exporter family protein LysE/ArgO
MHTGAFAHGLLLSLSLCLDLGIVNLALMHTAMRAGLRPAVMLGLGSALGDLCYALLSASSLALLLQFRGVRLALWLCGSAALLYLMLRMLRESLAPHALAGAAQPPGCAATAAGAPRAAAHFRRGLLLALASPSAILWFAAVGGSLIAASARTPGVFALFLAGFALAGILWSFALATLVARTHHLLGRSGQRLAALASALLFAYFAVEVMAKGYREFMLTAS